MICIFRFVAMGFAVMGFAKMLAVCFAVMGCSRSLQMMGFVCVLQWGMDWFLSFGFRWVGCGNDLVVFFFFLLNLGFWWAVGNGGVVGMVVVVWWWLGYLVVERGTETQKGRDGDERKERDNLFIILLYNFYYFSV